MLVKHSLGGAKKVLKNTYIVCDFDTDPSNIGSFVAESDGSTAISAFPELATELSRSARIILSDIF